MALAKRKNRPNYRLIYRLVALGILLVLFYSIGGHKGFYKCRPLIRNIENKIILYKTRNFEETETASFIYRYEDIDGETLELIKATAEDKYRQIKNKFAYGFKDKILLVIYNDLDLMMDTTMVKKGQPPIGVYYGNSIHISNPNIWIEDRDQLEDRFYTEGPILHELAHLFTDHIGSGNFPIWFTEGVSLYFEYIVDNYEWGKDLEEDIYSLGELNSNFSSLNQYQAYAMSFRLVKNMVDNHGLNKLIDLIALLGKGQSIDNFLYLFEEFSL